MKEEKIESNANSSEEESSEKEDEKKEEEKPKENHFIPKTVSLVNCITDNNLCWIFGFLRQIFTFPISFP